MPLYVVLEPRGCPATTLLNSSKETFVNLEGDMIYRIEQQLRMNLYTKLGRSQRMQESLSLKVGKESEDSYLIFMLTIRVEILRIVVYGTGDATNESGQSFRNSGKGRAASMTRWQGQFKIS